MLEHSREYFEPFSERLLLRLPLSMGRETEARAAADEARAAEDARRDMFERRRKSGNAARDDEDGAGDGLGGGGVGVGWRAMSASSVAASGDWRDVAAAALAETGIVDRPGTHLSGQTTTGTNPTHTRGPKCR